MKKNVLKNVLVVVKKMKQKWIRMV